MVFKLLQKKVQKTSLIQSLGIIIEEYSLCPQNQEICKDCLKTLSDSKNRWEMIIGSDSHLSLLPRNFLHPSKF